MPRDTNTLAFIRLNDTVEDRTLYTGVGRVVYLEGNDVHIDFDCGAEEVLDADHFRHHHDRHWII